MNRIVILGNGFDIAHGLLTSYRDFIKYVQNEFVDFVNSANEEQITNEHSLFYFTPAESVIIDGHEQPYTVCKRHEIIKSWDDLPCNVSIKNNYQSCSAQVSFRNELLGHAFVSSKSTTWGGFENDYKNILVNIIKQKPSFDSEIIPNNYTVEKLNNDLGEIIELLYNYLKQLRPINTLNGNILSKLLTKPLRKSRMDNTYASRYGEIPIINKNEEDEKLEHVLFLSFNYTSTIQKYLFRPENFDTIDKCNLEYNSRNKITTSLRYIHGDLDDNTPSSLIFGYGDELDENQAILETLDDEFLRHIKTVLYTRSPYYREIIDFAEADEFDIIIYGHSCSTTDRTLLNTLFEHENCVSIQPYLYDPNDMSIYTNIYRCFKDKKLMRSRVVDQTSTIRDNK